MTVHLDRLLIDDRDRRDLCGPEVQGAITLGQIEEAGAPEGERGLGSGLEVGRGGVV